jgi:hypothetical protein
MAAVMILLDLGCDREQACALSDLLVQRLLSKIFAEEYFLTDAAVLEALEEKLSGEFLAKVRA